MYFSVYISSLLLLLLLRDGRLTGGFYSRCSYHPKQRVDSRHQVANSIEALEYNKLVKEEEAATLH